MPEQYYNDLHGKNTGISDIGIVHHIRDINCSLLYFFVFSLISETFMIFSIAGCLSLL